MLPGALFSTYKQYKDDTKKIIEWLAEAANRCGYGPNAEVPNSVVKKQKLKGRARKLARDAATKVESTSSTSSTSSTQSCTVKVREIVPMTQSIIDSTENKVVIPVNIIKVFKRCIEARDTTSKWYEQATASSTEKYDNLTHGHFTETLKQSLRMLIPVAKLRELDETRFAIPKPDVEVNTSEGIDPNRFVHLEIQDIDEKEYEALADSSTKIQASTSVDPAPVTNKKKKKYVPEELNEFDEFHFALVCLMEDVGTLQRQVAEAWEEYAEGEVDLTTAAVTTNTAIEMVKKAEEEFSKLKRPSAYQGMYRESVPDMWFAECCIRDEISPTQFKGNDNMKYFVPMEAWEQAKESYMLIFRLATIYSKGIIPGKTGNGRIFATTRPAYMGTYNPELEFDELSPERQYEQMSALLGDMFSTLGGYCVLGHLTPNDDMLLEALSHFQRHQIDPPLWLLFACQTFLDIHFTLKTRSERPWEELRDFAISARKTLKDHKRFLQAYPLPHMRPELGEDELAIGEILEELEVWIFGDQIKQILTSAPVEGTKTKKRRVWQDYELLRMSPLMCGMWKYCFQIQLQWKGITLVNDCGIVTAAHLYNGLQQNDYLGTESGKLFWEDMEYLLDLHRAEDTFLSEKRPVSIEDCTKRLALVQGVAPQTFARRRRGNNHRVLRSRAGSKFLVPSTPVAKVFGMKFLTPTEGEWHLDQLDAVIGQKFEKDAKKFVATNEKFNAVVDRVDLDTEEGRQELLLSFIPPQLKPPEKKFEDLVYISVLIAELQISRAVLDCRWVTPVAKVIDEEKSKHPNIFASPSDEDEDSAENDEPSETDELKAKSSKGKEPEAKRMESKGKMQTMLETTSKGKKDNHDHDHHGEDSSEDEWEDEEEDEDEEFEGNEPGTDPGVEAFMEMMERWQQTKTLPLHVFIDVLRDSLQIEYLDIQFDYFAFFRSVFSLMLKIQGKLLPFLNEHLVDTLDGPNLKALVQTNEGAVCAIPQLALLVACNPFEAPNILTIKPWFEVDLRPLQMIAKIMRPWIKAHGDEYCLDEQEREDRRRDEVTKDAPPVKYIDSESDDDENIHDTPAKEEAQQDELEAKLKKSAANRKIGWSSSVGIVPGLNAKQIRAVFDDQRTGGATGMTVAQTMAKLHGLELDDGDKELIAMNEELIKGIDEAKEAARARREKEKQSRKREKRKQRRQGRDGTDEQSQRQAGSIRIDNVDDAADFKVDPMDELD